MSADERVPYSFSLCRIGSEEMTHLGVDYFDDHPAAKPGHPRRTLCGHPAVPLRPGEDPWKDRGEVGCYGCLAASETLMDTQGWPSAIAALAAFERYSSEADA